KRATKVDAKRATKVDAKRATKVEAKRATKVDAKRATKVDTKLARYNEKRDFGRTPEPSGRSKQASQAGRSELQFVVQKHAARSLHYDFRLELDGVLLSWSVPKGPSLKPGLRRLAVRTEDHPLDYADFEGTIPKGEYGGGTVIVWDRGTWQSEGDPTQGVKAGRLTFDLQGEKLRGRFHLVRTRPSGKQEQWLLFKGKGEGASDTLDVASEQTLSVISGRSLEDVARDPDRVWHSNKPAKKGDTAAKRGSASGERVATKPGKPAGTAATSSDTVALVKKLPLPFELTNLEKTLYPDVPLRKADVIAYYASVAEHMLPHVKGRPLTLVRCPNGAGTKCFFQKHANDTVPDVIQRVAIKEGKAHADYMALRDMQGLVALAQLGVLEVHTWGCHVPDIDRPDKLIFDIDPDTSVGWDAVIEAAIELRQRLYDIGIKTFVQTTGGKGLHVVAPIKPSLDWDELKQFTHAVADAMAAEHPKLYLTNMRKDLRKGRIFLDYLRNGRGATAVAPYSTRARSGATVAAPLTWDELIQGAQPSDFTVRSMIERLSRQEEDPWAGYHSLRQSITPAALRSVS
ncbi:MAG: non-homologous end-joining DNA ligase, partial [Polyangiales bacterium]